MSGEHEATTTALLGQPLPLELMNTVSGQPGGGVHDALQDEDEAAAWLHAITERIAVEAGSAPGHPDPAGVRTAARTLRHLRDALRRLAAEATHDPRPPANAPELTRSEAISKLNALATTWPELVWLPEQRPSRVYRSRGSTDDFAVHLIAHRGVELFTGADLGRLRPCLAPNCLRFFVAEHARREWCSPECGNRARVARHYRRHQANRQDDRPPFRRRR